MTLTYVASFKCGTQRSFSWPPLAYSEVLRATGDHRLRVAWVLHLSSLMTVYQQQMSYPEQLADYAIRVPIQRVQQGSEILVAAAGLNKTPARERQRTRLLPGNWLMRQT